jgi:predicted RecA/RadA family phage recombinase
MSKNLVYGEVDTVTYVAGADLVSGRIKPFGALCCVLKAAVANGSSVAAWIKGLFKVTKLAGEAWTMGCIVYWDDTNNRCTTTATSNNRIGIAAAAAGSSDTTGYVVLNAYPGPNGA